MAAAGFTLEMSCSIQSFCGSLVMHYALFCNEVKCERTFRKKEYLLVSCFPFSDTWTITFQL